MTPAELQRFGDALDAVRTRIEAELGAGDVRYIARVDAASRALELVGRGLIFVSFEPVSFAGGVACLWLGKQLQATEIGHASLHGAYDHLPASARYRAAAFHWRMPIDEALWREIHNVRHHPYTNIVGKDPGVGALPVNQHAGALRTRDVLARAAPKAAAYYAREYVLFPVLAGPLWWKVLLGNWLSEVLRDAYSAAALYAGHDGHDVAYYPEGTKARSRADWYRMQVEATNNFAVPRVFSILCGGLDLHIEHHLFPKLPPNRLRQIAPEIRRICEEHGLTYKIDTWGNTLRKVFRALRSPGAVSPDAPGAPASK